MITGKQAQKLVSNNAMIEHYKTYETFLKKVSRKLQRAIKNHNSVLQVTYVLFSDDEYTILTEIVDEYKEVGYDVRLVKYKQKENEKNPIYGIKFLF